MSLNIWLIFTYGFLIYLSSSAKFCVRRFVNGKWISKGDCGGPETMSEMQKELQSKIKDQKKKCIAGKGWTVFQCRVNGDVDFYRGWDDYRKGFGDSEGDLWLGLEELHKSTKDGDMELEINMITKDKGIHSVAKYSNFRVGPGSDNYTLHVSGHSGNATDDALSSSNNQQFSTKDEDHDGQSSVNCASLWEGAWWYRACGWGNMNGNFNKLDKAGIWWRSYSNLMRFSEMKFRKRL